MSPRAPKWAASFVALYCIILLQSKNMFIMLQTSTINQILRFNLIIPELVQSSKISGRDCCFWLAATQTYMQISQRQRQGRRSIQVYGAQRMHSARARSGKTTAEQSLKIIPSARPLALLQAAVRQLSLCSFFMNPEWATKTTLRSVPQPRYPASPYSPSLGPRRRKNAQVAKTMQK